MEDDSKFQIPIFCISLLTKVKGLGGSVVFTCNSVSLIYNMHVRYRHRDKDLLYNASYLYSCTELYNHSAWNHCLVNNRTRSRPTETVALERIGNGHFPRNGPQARSALVPLWTPIIYIIENLQGFTIALIKHYRVICTLFSTLLSRQ
jgi:hypothetical protein